MDADGHSDPRPRWGYGAIARTLRDETDDPWTAREVSSALDDLAAAIRETTE